MSSTDAVDASEPTPGETPEITSTVTPGGASGPGSAPAAGAEREVPAPDLEELDLRITSLDLGDDAVFITDPDGTIVEVNDAFVRVTGYPRDEAIGSTPRLLSSGLQDDEFYEELWGTIKAGRVWQGQMVDRRRDGALRTFHSTITPLIDGHGSIRYFLALERDVTGELGITAQGQAAGLVHTDLLGRGTYADGLAAAMLERRPSELLGGGLLKAMHEEDAEAFQELIGRAVETGHEHRTEIRSLVGRWLQVTVAPMTVSSGDVIGATCVLRDVDDRISAQRTIERQQALVDSVLNSFDEPVCVIGPDGRVVALNRAWTAGEAGLPEPINSATSGSDLVHLARTAAERTPADDHTPARLYRDLQRASSGVIAPPRRDHGFVVTPLAWEDGGAVVRWLGAG